MATKLAVIKFFRLVVDGTIDGLMDAGDHKMKHGAGRFTVLISSPGGWVFHGLSGETVDRRRPWGRGYYW